jgi:hypothetical protein
MNWLSISKPRRHSGSVESELLAGPSTISILDEGNGEYRQYVSRWSVLAIERVRVDGAGLN